MANPSSRKTTQALLQRFLHSSPNPSSVQTSFRNYHSSCSSSSSSSSLPSGFSNSRHLAPEISFHQISSTSPKFLLSHQQNSILIRNFTSLIRRQLPPGSGRVLGLGYTRHFSIKTPDFTKRNASLVDKTLSAVKSVFSRYRQAIGLQIEAFWKNNYLFMVGALGLGLCLLLWRLMFGIANTFVGFSEGMAKYGFLALSSAIVAFAGLYVRSRFTINPDRVYRIAMRNLNTSAGILEVMGAPLSGTDLRAYVMSGGGLALKNFKPKFAKKRCFLIFPIRGSERKGLVSVEVKKNKGQYDMKLLSVDVPMKAGPDQRFFLVGDEEEYRIGGGLIAELRDPIVKAMAAQKEFEALDQKEEEEDEKREREEAERKNREEIEKLEKESTQ